MKYVVLVGDGMADRPLKELEGRTPLEAARTTNMDKVAEDGVIGSAITVPQGLNPASDVANMALLGYDPSVYYTGRGPLEAANMGIELSEDEIAFRCNVVTISEEKMADYSAGHITTKEASIIIDFINQKLASDAIKFYPGVSYRHLAVINFKKAKLQKEGLLKTLCTPPHDILGKMISRYLPRGEASGFLTDLMLRSEDLLASHDVNRVRVDLNENPANMIWLWGQGIKSEMPLFSKKYNITGSIISAVDLIKGIGKIIDLEPIDVPGATGYYDTDYMAKANYALESLKSKDFAFVHVEAPDEAGHNGDLRQKILAIENFDKMIVGAIVDGLKKANEEFRVLVLPDHATPVSVRTHTNDPIPFAMCGKGIEKDDSASYDEVTAQGSKLFIKDGYTLMDAFLK